MISKRRGTTVLELLLATAIIATGGVATVEAVRFAQTASLKATYQAAALAAAQGVIEDARAYASSLTPGSSVSGGFATLPAGTKATTTVTADLTRSGVYLVQVDVSWTKKGNLGELSGAVHLETLVYAN